MITSDGLPPVDLSEGVDTRAAAKPDAATARNRELILMEHFRLAGIAGLTSDEAAKAARMDIRTAQPGVTALKQSGKIVVHGPKRLSDRGKAMGVLVDADLLQRIEQQKQREREQQATAERVKQRDLF